MTESRVVPSFQAMLAEEQARESAAPREPQPDDLMEAHCNHCGERVFRAQLQPMQYLGWSEQWCTHCRRTAMEWAMQQSRSLYMTPAGNVVVLTSPIPIRPDKEREFSLPCPCGRRVEGARHNIVGRLVAHIANHSRLSREADASEAVAMQPMQRRRART